MNNSLYCLLYLIPKMYIAFITNSTVRSTDVSVLFLYFLHNIFYALRHIRIDAYCPASKTFRYNGLIHIQSDQTDIIMFFYQFFKWEPDNCRGVMFIAHHF